MATARVVRGRESEEWVAEKFRYHGWVNAERRPASLPGTDIMGLPPFAVEVKARRDLNLTQWLKQASARSGLPMVIHRPDGFGRDKLGLWPVTFRFDDVIPVLWHWDKCSGTGCSCFNDGHMVTSGHGE